MASPLRERISGVDTAWLRMDSPESPMTIVGVFAFEARLDEAAVKRAISSRFLAYHRFRSYPTEDATGAWWKVSHEFDLDEHVVRARLPGKAGKRELERYVGRLASTPLARGRPLWQFHLVENYGAGSALIPRIHHCYADGIALVRVILSLTDTSAEASRAAPEGPVDGEAEPQGDLWAQAFGPISQLLAEGLQSAMGKGIDIAAESAKLALMGRDAPTRLKGPLVTTKRVAWADPLPLDEVKAIAKAMDCSVNDVLVAMAAGALREYLRAKGDAVDGIEVRAIVPVNLRPLEEAARLGNQFGMVFLDLPVGIEHPLERLYEVRRRMGALKRSYQPVIALALLRAVGSGPKAMQDQVTGFLGKNASLVITNVPGPQRPLYFAGERIAELEFWVPQSGGIGLGLSLLSYDGKVQFGVMGDAARVPDPRRIAERFGEEFAKLMWITLMSPWSEGAAAPASARVRNS
jgi:WS/DGAT/MGAT family acyltransferase